MKRILVADDSRDIGNAIKLYFQGEYEVHIAHDGIEALEQAREVDPDLVILDIGMPKLDGFATMKELGRMHPTLPVFMMTGFDDLGSLQSAFWHGARDYLVKPIDLEELSQKIISVLDVAQAQEGTHADDCFLLKQSIHHKEGELLKTQLELINRLTMAAEYRDNETGMHILRMANYAALLGKIIGMSERDCWLLLSAVPMHDIGKVGIPDSILLKPIALTPEEMEVMRTHTVIGGQLLAGSDSELLQIGQIVALNHHEKWDGAGYPRGLSGDAIPIWARIAAVADVFDALTSKRPYKEAWPPDEAFAYIKEESGGHFDPDLVLPFLSLGGRLEEVMAKYAEEEQP